MVTRTTTLVVLTAAALVANALASTAAYAKPIHGPVPHAPHKTPPIIGMPAATSIRSCEPRATPIRGCEPRAAETARVSTQQA